MRHKPRDFFTAHLRLLVDALDADDGLAQTTTLYHVEVPLVRETFANRCLHSLDVVGSREKSEEIDHRQGVVHIGESRL